MFRYDVDQQLGTNKIFNICSIRALEGDVCADLIRGLVGIAQQAFDL